MNLYFSVSNSCSVFLKTTYYCKTSCSQLINMGDTEICVKMWTWHNLFVTSAVQKSNEKMFTGFRNPELFAIVKLHYLSEVDDLKNITR